MNKWGVMEKVNFGMWNFLPFLLGCQSPSLARWISRCSQWTHRGAKCSLKAVSIWYHLKTHNFITSNMFLDFHFEHLCASYLLFKAIFQMWQRKGGRARESVEHISRILDMANKKQIRVNSLQLVLLNFLRTKGALSMLISEITSEWHCGWNSSTVRVSVQCPKGRWFDPYSTHHCVKMSLSKIQNP